MIHTKRCLPPDDEQLACSKYLEDIVKKIELKKVHLVGSVI